ncbi:MAG: SPOR domain-containing protein [Nitrospina sp.]|nr:SPOR domain-containing protein [Nitrospina sp.]
MLELQDTNEDWEKYNKRLDTLSGEIQVKHEMETTKKIRIKNSKITIISSIGIALLILIYTQNKQSIIKQTTLTSENGSHFKYFTEKTDLKNHKSKINKNKNSSLKKISSSKDRANSYLTKNEPTLQGLSKKEQAPTKGKKFFVQVGAFSIKNNAEKVVKSLNSIGIKAKIYTQNIKIIKHQVFSENFTNKDNAISSVSNFKSLGITPSIKKSGTTYNLSLGLFNREQEANRFIKKLKKSGHELNKKIIKIDRNVYTVLSKGLATKIKAQQVKKDITNHGFKNSFIRFQ